MIKTYILDTNILVTSPYAILSFDEHNVSIADITLEELDRLKTSAGELGANARESIRILDTLRERGNLAEGVRLPFDNSGIFKIEINHLDATLPPSWDNEKADNRILRVCKGLQNDGDSPILVSNDINMRIKADILGIKAEEYKTEQSASIDKQYKGRRISYLKPGLVAKFYDKGKIDVDAFYEEEDPLTYNEFVLMKDAANDSVSALGRFDGTDIVALEYINETPYDVTPRNSGQRFIQEALLAPASEVPLVIIKGPAGSSKTFYSLACGLQKVMNDKEYSNILVIRPNIKFDDDIGYLKGTEEEKIAPLMRPIMDNLKKLTRMRDENGYGQSSYAQYLFDREYISAQAMAYMRGRTIDDTWIIADEFQNATVEQARGIVTRPEEHTKVILLGDPTQIDNPRVDSRTNGLSFAADRMKGSRYCRQITMFDSECVRSPLAKDAIERMAPKGYVQIGNKLSM